MKKQSFFTLYKPGSIGNPDDTSPLFIAKKKSPLGTHVLFIPSFDQKNNKLLLW